MDFAALLHHEDFTAFRSSFTIDKTRLFVPFNEATDNLQHRPGSLLVEIQPFVVITTRDVLLLDTGLGFADASGEMQLHGNLKKFGIQPEQVTKVLISHLHKDHSGGVSHGARQEVISFPNATYYIQKRNCILPLKKAFHPTYPKK
jgi:metal-dependent hydrolase (beta-lactamase superfamily II)